MPPQERFGWWRINLCSKKHNYYWMKLLLGHFFGTSMGKVITFYDKLVVVAVAINQRSSK